MQVKTRSARERRERPTAPATAAIVPGESLKKSEKVCYTICYNICYTVCYILYCAIRHS